MVKTSFSQLDFTHGELDEKLIYRTNLEFYFKSAKKLQNVVVLPQGSAKRRFGLEYSDLFDAPELKFIATKFAYSSSEQYLLIINSVNILIFKNGKFIHSIETTDYSIDILPQLKFARTQNLLVIFHPSVQTKTLERGDTDTDWTLSTKVFKNSPTFDFRSDYDDATFTFAVTAPGDDRKLTSSDPVFVANHVGGFFSGLGLISGGITQEGRARITQYNSPTEVLCKIITEFNAEFKTGAPGRECYLAEKVFGAARGWPVSGTFHDSRLIIGGSAQLADGVFWSAVSDYFNFDDTTGEPQDGATIQLATAGIQEIFNIVSDKTLQIFTASSEFATLEPVAGFELSTFKIRQQSNNGSNIIQPVQFDNATIYVGKGGKIIYSMIFDNDQSGYGSQSVSILAPQLIRNPVAMDIRKHATDSDANFLFFVNEDGTVACHQSVSVQNVNAFSLLETDGKFKSVVNVGDETYFIVQRNVYGSEVLYIERLNFDLLTDSAKLYDSPLPDDTLTGLEHLNGKTVNVIADGEVLKNVEVINGEVKLDKAVLKAEVGLPYYTKIIPMPVNLPPSEGDSVFAKKRIIKIFLALQNSGGVYVNGTILPEYYFGTDPLIPSPLNGIYEIIPHAGASRGQSIEIEQKEPRPMTVLAIGYELEVTR